MNSTNNKIIKSSMYVMIVVLLGKILGFLKQMVIAWKFGTNPSIDVYFTSDSFTCMLGQILILSIPPAIVTIYLKLKNDKEKESKFISSTFIFFIIIGIFLSVINCIFSTPLSNVLGISYDIGQKANLSRYITLLSPVILFSCIASVSSGVLQSKNKFLQDKFLGIFLSISIILSLIIFEGRLKVNSLLFGFLFGYFIYTAMMLILLFKNINIKPCNPFKNDTFKKFLKILIPLLIGTSIVDFSHLIDKIIASSLNAGSVSALYYSQIICSDLVNSVIISSIGLVLLPKLTMDVDNKPKIEIINSIRKIFSIAIPIILLITILYIFDGEYLIKLVFERGEFNQNSTLMVSKCMFGYSVGLVFVFIKEILSRFFYALNDTFSPMISNVIGIVINIILSIILSKKIGVQGIAYATSISIVISVIILLILLKKHINLEKLLNLDFIIEIIKYIIIMIMEFIIMNFASTISFNSYVYELVILALISIIVFITMSYLLKINLYYEFKNIKQKRKGVLK